MPPRLPLALAAALLAAATAAAQEQPPVEFRIKLQKDAAWKVEQTIDFKGTLTGKHTKTSTEQPLVKGAWKLQEAWGDVCTLDAEGRPMSVRRTVTASKVGGPAAKSEGTSLEGAVLMVEEKEKEPTCKVSFSKGKPAQLTVDALSKGPVDPVALLFPAAAVKVGEEFKVQAHYVCMFQRAAASGMASASTSRLADFAKLMEYLKSFGASPQGCDVTGKVAKVEKGEAVVEYGGKTDDGVASVEVKAVLKWSVARGRPVSLEWTQTRQQKSNEDAGTGGYTEEWKLVKTWK